MIFFVEYGHVLFWARRFDQTDASLAKFDSSALEKILNSLSATSLRDHDDGLKTNNDNCNDDDYDDVDQVWMRHDVVDDACQSSLSMLDAAAAQLDNGQHFKSRRRRSSSSSSSSSSVGHCSPSCLMPSSTLDTDPDTSTQLFFSCVAESSYVETLTDVMAISANATPDDLPSTSTSLKPAEAEKSSQTAG